MIYFLYVPMEGGAPGMSALDTVGDDDSARAEAGHLQYGGRTGYLFDGDRFVGEIATASGVLQDAPMTPSPTWSGRARDLPVAPTAG